MRSETDTRLEEARVVSTGWGGCGIGSTLSAPVSSFVGPASSKLSDSGRSYTLELVSSLFQFLF